MYKIRKNLIVLLMFIFASQIVTSTFAIDLSEFGDFESRSSILNSLNKKNTLTKEQKDLLLQKKLTPTTACLIEQIKKGNVENVSLLLSSNININQSYMSEYPIYIAAKENEFEILKLLFENGAKLDRGFNSELYSAVSNKNFEMAQYLIENGANVNYIDAVSDNTVLYMALKNSMVDIASLMIQKGAKPDKKSVKYIKKKKLQSMVENALSN